jgi:hypothetical protein
MNRIIILILFASVVHSLTTICHITEKLFYDINFNCSTNQTHPTNLLFPLSQYCYHTGTNYPDTALLNQYRP